MSPLDRLFQVYSLTLPASGQVTWFAHLAMLHAQLAYLDRHLAPFKKVATNELSFLTSAEHTKSMAGRTHIGVPLVGAQIHVPGGLGLVILDGNHRLKKRQAQQISHTWIYLIDAEHEHQYRLTQADVQLLQHTSDVVRAQAFRRFEDALQAAYTGLYQRGHVNPDIRFPITNSSPMTQAPTEPRADERWPGLPKPTSISSLLQPPYV